MFRKAPVEKPGITIFELWSHKFECHACGKTAYGHLGIPCYEDEVLPDDDPGEWGGFPACETCHAAQMNLTYRVRLRELTPMLRFRNKKWQVT